MSDGSFPLRKKFKMEEVMKILRKKFIPLFFVLLFLTVSLFSSQKAFSEVNGTMMQAFHWYLPNDGNHWNWLKGKVPELSSAGFTALWLPPAYKGSSQADVGYGVYDMYDLGEFEQKGTVRTKYGIKDQYIDLIKKAHESQIQIYADVVFNHRGGADYKEQVSAIPVAGNNRNHDTGSQRIIGAWTGFNFLGRHNKYSAFKWNATLFDGTDYDANTGQNAIFRINMKDKHWDWPVDDENGNYDYLMFADLDFDHPAVVNELKNWGVWYANFTGINGYRIDAVKHIKFSFFPQWIDHVRSQTDKNLFMVGEYWNYNVDDLHYFIQQSWGRMHLFDAPLHNNFYNASRSNGDYDMGSIMNNTLMKEQPSLAVTLVENHDTQPLQALESPVMDWFKPLAYAFILLRSEGYPCVFFADYYGAQYRDKGRDGQDYDIQMASHKWIIDKLLWARKNFAYGNQISFLDHKDIIGWTRLGNESHPKAMAVIMTDKDGGSKWMNVGKSHTNFKDILGHQTHTVTTNEWGWGEFSTKGGSVSVWVQE